VTVLAREALDQLLPEPLRDALGREREQREAVAAVPATWNGDDAT
jgi:hypothetical protein